MPSHSRPPAREPIATAPPATIPAREDPSREQIATGLEGFEIDETVRDAAGRVRPFVVVVRAPEAARVHVAMIERFIEREQPAPIRCDLAFTSIPAVAKEPP